MILRNKSLKQRQAVSKAWKGKKLSEEYKNKIRLGVLKAYEEGRLKKKYGKDNGNYGKKQSEKQRQIARETFMAAKKDPEYRRKHREGIRKYSALHPEEKAKTFKKLNKDPEFTKKRLKGLCKRPTKPEKRVIELIDKYNLQFKYVGNGEVIIHGLNPDFIECNGKKQIIEVFSRFWHQKYKGVDWKRTEGGRKEIFSQLGYTTLILWDDEILNNNDEYILNKIKNI